MIGVVDIDLCNLRSVANAVDALGFDVQLVRSPAELGSVSHVILPGVGSFRVAAERLAARGFGRALAESVGEGKPLLGICLGMQLLADEGEEGGLGPGLGTIGGRVVRLAPGPGYRIPHVGWNTVVFDEERPHPVFAGLKPRRDFYFVHSYRFATTDPRTVLGRTELGSTFDSVVARDNVVGVQFHPEKSQVNGQRILQNFCAWNGRC